MWGIKKKKIVDVFKEPCKNCLHLEAELVKANTLLYGLNDVHRQLQARYEVLNKRIQENKTVDEFLEGFRMIKEALEKK